MSGTERLSPRCTRSRSSCGRQCPYRMALVQGDRYPLSLQEFLHAPPRPTQRHFRIFGCCEAWFGRDRHTHFKCWEHRALQKFLGCHIPSKSSSSSSSRGVYVIADSAQARHRGPIQPRRRTRVPEQKTTRARDPERTGLTYLSLAPSPERFRGYLGSQRGLEGPRKRGTTRTPSQAS